MYRLFIFFILAVFINCKKGNEKLKVAVAANARYALEDVRKAFEREAGTEVELIIGSSGKLTAQIREGAPYDIFLSADMKYPEALFSEGLTQTSPKIYAYGELVLWSVKLDTFSLNTLQEPEVEKIALANPDVAPYGQAAVEVMHFFGMYETAAPKLVFGENISQTSQYILNEAADLGFTAKSLLLSPELKGKGTWVEIDPQAYRPIAQGAVLIRRSNHKDAADFYKFLFSEPSKRIFREFGYSVR